MVHLHCSSGCKYQVCRTPGFRPHHKRSLVKAKPRWPSYGHSLIMCHRICSKVGFWPNYFTPFCVRSFGVIWGGHDFWKRNWNVCSEVNTNLKILSVGPFVSALEHFWSARSIGNQMLTLFDVLTTQEPSFLYWKNQYLWSFLSIPPPPLWNK